VKTLALGNPEITLNDLAEMAGQEAVIVTRHDKPVFALVPVEAEDIATWQLGENPQFLALLQRAWDRARREGWVTLAEARQRLLNG
jgi:antitoxin (DNA-binding transcriptional repressor) of toxin-antitoxin stability system